MKKYSEKEILTSYQGRCISDKEDLKGGYCGSASIEIHRNQLSDPKSWVHSSVLSWIEKAEPKPTIEQLKAEIKKLKQEKADCIAGTLEDKLLAENDKLKKERRICPHIKGIKGKCENDACELDDCNVMGLVSNCHWYFEQETQKRRCKMECPHCKKEVFGKGHNVEQFYEEPPDVTPLEIAIRQAKLFLSENEQLQKELDLAKSKALAISQAGGYHPWMKQEILNKDSQIETLKAEKEYLEDTLDDKVAEACKELDSFILCEIDHAKAFMEFADEPEKGNMLGFILRAEQALKGGE